MKETMLTCIVCPSSCRITVRETQEGLEYTGYTCKRGLEHARNEMTQPMRMLTSTVAVLGASLRSLPVISTKEVPRQLLRECLEAVYQVKVQAPVQAGQIIIKNICDTGADVIAARSMRKAE